MVGPVFGIAELLIVPLVLPPQMLHRCDEIWLSQGVIVDLGTKSRQQKPQSWFSRFCAMVMLGKAAVATLVAFRVSK